MKIYGISRESSMEVASLVLAESLHPQPCLPFISSVSEFIVDLIFLTHCGGKGSNPG